MEDLKLTKHYRDTSVPENWDRKGLPGWCYKSPSLLNLEIDNVFLNHWQIICHVSDVRDRGDFITFESDRSGSQKIYVKYMRKIITADNGL